MTALDLEAEYNNRTRVPEHPAIQERWRKASESYRATATADLDRTYGSGERQRYDLFKQRAGAGNAPLVVYIHGGYWQRGDRRDVAFVARELNARGVAVALPSYSLCPAVGIMDIVAEMRQCLKVLWETTKQRPVVVGHSAGGHLAAAMLATDWSMVAGVPADLVRAAYSISGVFDLPPLVATSINDAVKLMRSPALEAFDLNKVPTTTLNKYGDTPFGRGCILAKRLVETGVRFVQVNRGGFDTHTANFPAMTGHGQVSYVDGKALSLYLYTE